MSTTDNGTRQPLRRALLVIMAQVLLLGAVYGKLLYDREALPRAWAPMLGLDPELPIRGRYVALNAIVEIPDGDDAWRQQHRSEPELAPGTTRHLEVNLRVDTARQVLQGIPTQTPDASGDDLRLHGRTRPVVREMQLADGSVRWVLTEPIAFFLPESVPDPTARAPDEELWAEVTLTPANRLRPIRLALREGNQFLPLPSR
jgi:hypothetical protein